MGKFQVRVEKNGVVGCGWLLLKEVREAVNVLFSLNSRANVQIGAVTSVVSANTEEERSNAKSIGKSKGGKQSQLTNPNKGTRKREDSKVKQL